MATTQARPKGLGALLLIVVGVWFFLQGSFGELVERLQSFFPGKSDPKGAGAPGSAAVATVWNRKALKLSPTVKLTQRGDPIVYNTLMPACSRAGGGFVAISWFRGAGEKTSSGRPSCHRHGKRSGKGALDIVHESGEYKPLDDLEYELHILNAGEVLFRGYANHDPKLTEPGKTPHVHAAVNCG